MKKQNPFKLDEGARRMIFAGVPVSVLGVLVLVDSYEPAISDKVWIYSFWGAVMVIAVFGMVAYNITPKRFVLPLGIVGWIISFSILCWSVWFKSGHASSHW